MAPHRVAIERILCPTDFSECSRRALTRAVQLASWFDARVSVLHALATSPWVGPVDAMGAYLPASGEMLETQRAQVSAALARFVEPELGRGVPIETRLTEGDPAAAIQSAAQELCADLVVMGTHGTGGFEHLLLGSVTEKVLRRATCPVLTLGHDAQTDASGPLFRRILCAADLTEDSQRTLDLALSLAEENLAHVTLLHVVEGVLGETGPQLYRPVPESALWHATVTNEARERLALAANPARTFCNVRTRVETGTAWRQVLRVAQETSADLIVVGAHAGGALGRLFFGSTANQVVRHARCPVLIARAMRVRPTVNSVPTATDPPTSGMRKAG